MGSAVRPRGRLPRRVYWVRRSVVLGLALLLVFGIGKLLGDNGKDDGEAATPAGNSAPSQAASASVSLGPVAPPAKLRNKNKVPLSAPNGPCLDDDVSVLPTVPSAAIGSPVVILLSLQGTQPACTFDVSPDSVVVKITSGKDRIWSSQECQRSIAKTQVVVRSGQPVVVPVVWSGRRSDVGCPGSTTWALPGFYHVFAAALGSTSRDVQFEVTRAAPTTVTRSPRPKPSASTSAAASAPAKPAAKVTPAAKPSPSVKGKQSKCGGDTAEGSC